MRRVETVLDALWLVYWAFVRAGGPAAQGYADAVLDIVESDPVRPAQYRAR